MTLCKYCGLNYGALGIMAVNNWFQNKKGLRCPKSPDGVHRFEEREVDYGITELHTGDVRGDATP